MEEGQVTVIKDLKETEVKYICKNCGSVVVTSGNVNLVKRGCCDNPEYEKFAVLTSLEPHQIRMLLADCYSDMLKVIKRYVDMPEDKMKIIAIWTIGTYFHEAFNTYPFLFFNAMRGSGKTRTLKLISALGAKGDGSVQNNLTDAVLFRIPKGTTTCIDEVEQIGSKEKQTLRELLNSAYKKGMKVKRMKKVKKNGEENQVAETFEPYSPIAMANIWGVEEVLADRSIVIILEKSNNPAITKMVEDFDCNDTIYQLKRTLEAVSVVSVMSLREKNYIQKWNDYIHNKYNGITTLTTLTTYNNTKQHQEQDRYDKLKELDLEEFFNKIDNLGIHGRNFELLFPLLLVAQHIHDEVFDDILKIGSQIIQDKKEDEYSDSKDVSLYEFVCSDYCTAYGLTHIPLKEMTIKFREFLGDSDDQDRWLNDKWLGKALKRLNLLLDKKRVSSGRLVMLNYAKAKEKIKMFKGEEKKE